MYIVIENQVVFVSKEEFEAHESELSLLFTDKIEDNVYLLYSWDGTSYRISEEGKFLKLRTEEEQKARWLDKVYIPSRKTSTIRKVQYILKGDTVSDDYKLSTAGLYSEWEPSSYAVGDIRNHAGQTWECIQAHDNAVYPDITPDNPQTWHTFWKPLHGKSEETARPWVKPQYGTTDMYHTGEYMIYTDGKSSGTARPWVKPQFGTTDMYLAGEYMIYTDGKKYKCLSGTVYSPEEYSEAWEVQS